MTKKGVLTINDFAKFSRTTRDTLLHYDKIGLLSPVSRGENNYRYYSSDQLAVMNVVRTLQALGMSLAEIKRLKSKRSPDFVDELFTRQIDEIDAKIDEWVRARKLLFTLKKSINSVSGVDESAVTLQYLPEEPIVLGGVNDYSQERHDYDALLSFYHEINKTHPEFDLNYPVWGFFSKERVQKGDWVWPDRYYFCNPEGKDKKPAALYAIGYQRGGYGYQNKLYERVTEYIAQEGYEICGGAYEEYPLNEVCIPNNTEYLVRLMIPVCKPK